MAGRSKTAVPIALPTVRIQVSDDGPFGVTVDKEPYAVPPGFRRDQVRGLLEDLASELGPIRVEITESNGEKYVDIDTPGDRTLAPPEPSPREPATYGFHGRFEAGEDVVVAVVVARRTASTDGTVTVRLPPAFLQKFGDDLVLIGQTTKASTRLADVDQGVRS